ncbi:hypothetical protein GCM10027436_48570 [Actinophytocola sediminis]
MTANLAAISAVPSDAKEPRDPKTFMSEDQWERLVDLMVRDYPWDTVMADRVLGQAVAYLITAMETWGQNLEIGCGYLVDIGVHTMILDTPFYREFCQKYHGKFLEHMPEIARKVDGSVEKTAKIIAGNGFAVDWTLWEADYANCSPCRPGHDH